MKNKITINCHNSIRIEDDKIIYFDPFKIENKLNDADLIFITHDHYDHFDINSIKNIIKEDTKIVVPNSIVEKVLSSGINNDNLISVDVNSTYTILGYKVETIPSYNLNKDFHIKEYNYVGYIITINNDRIYVAGDTDATEECKNVNCDIALIPIGGTYTMDYKEAAELINIIEPKIVIPTHYNCVVGNLSDGENFKNLVNDNIECILKIK